MNADVFVAIGRGGLGVAVLVGLASLLSSDRKSISWRLVGSGLLLQLLLAFLVLKVPVAQSAVGWMSNRIVDLLGFSEAGAGFVFGDLAQELNFGLAFKVLPVIIFFSALSSVLYYLGILQWIVYGFAWCLNRVMRLSGAESLAAAANVFVGQTEAPLLVKPFIERMTRSELMALMTGGMATIAGSVMGVYIDILGGGDLESKRQFGQLLICASIMNAPAALLIAKILLPQTEEVSSGMELSNEGRATNLLDSLARGTTDGLMLALNVAAMLIVFVAFIAMINGLLGWVGAITPLGAWVNQLSGGVFPELSLQGILGFAFAPIAWIIGVEMGDLLQMGQLLGQKIVLNEFIAFQNLAEFKGIEGALSPRTVFLATFALCGFANFGSIGIQLGGIGVLAPGQKKNLAQLAMKAMIGGAMASLLTTSMAGMFYAGNTP
ncbi:MAG: nucleoside transporter C-terminal domain-containing protein [Verrucomicrobiota bacterium]